MIGIVAHVEKAGAADLVLALAHSFQAKGVSFLLEEKTAALIARNGEGSVSEVADRCELLVVLGGDGTILRVVHDLKNDLPPIFGINLGTLGFLTCLGASELDSAVDSIVAKDYCLSERAMLQASLFRKEGNLWFEGLNDVVISRGERSQLVKVRVSIDSLVLTEYYADGLIVSSPTGSTAYSLSAGGPILMPDSGSLVVTPICPHVLTNRSVVVGDASRIVIEPTEEDQEIFVAVDGQDATQIGSGDSVEIRKSERVLRLAMLSGRNFSQVLRQKLKWSGSNI